MESARALQVAQPACCRGLRVDTPEQLVHRWSDCARCFGHLDKALWQSFWMSLILRSSEIQGEHQRQAPKISQAFLLLFLKPRKWKPFLYVKTHVQLFGTDATEWC